jgi:hypothetical protein
MNLDMLEALQWQKGNDKLYWESFWNKKEKKTDIVNFEIKYKIKLPKEYINILLNYQNAELKDDKSIKFYSNILECEVEYSTWEFLAIWYNELVSFTSYIDRKLNHIESFPLQIIPFSNLWNGDMICFDYRYSNNNPFIVVWHCQAEPWSSEELSYLAKNFSSFLKNIK